MPVPRTTCIDTIHDTVHVDISFVHVIYLSAPLFLPKSDGEGFLEVISVAEV